MSPKQIKKRFMAKRQGSFFFVPFWQFFLKTIEKKNRKSKS